MILIIMSRQILLIICNAIVTEYMKLSAYSVGISDLIADDKTNQRIISAVNEKKERSK